MENEIFKNIVEKQAKRMLGFIDNDPNSDTYGCADRYYWHYKLNDYYNARFQEIGLTLAFFYKDQNFFLYKNEKLLDLIRGIIKFWADNLNSNGSVNEIFPHEQSFCATSFSSFAISETLELLDLGQEKTGHMTQFIKCGEWLVKNGNWHIANQVAASALALYNLGKIYHRDDFIEESKKRISRLMEGFENNGYFSEYGGFDLGYNTLTMSLLARIYQKNPDNKILGALQNVNSMIDKLIDENGYYDYKNMSRHTQFIYPFSFSLTKSPILQKIKNGLEKDAILNPAWLDDRYLIGLANDYLYTYYLK